MQIFFTGEMITKTHSLASPFSIKMPFKFLFLPTEERKNKTKKTEQTPWRQVDTVFVIEIILVAYFFFFFVLIADILNTGLIWLLMFILLGQFFGLLLKCAHYKLFHIWTDILNVKNLRVKKEHVYVNIYPPTRQK